jgi:hypothetical protein
MDDLVWAYRWGVSIAVTALLILAACLCFGCSHGRLVEAERPAQPSTVTAVSDTVELKQLPPVPPPGTPTRPTTVRIYEDTLPTPTLEVQRVSVNRNADPEHVEVQYTVGDSTKVEQAQLPAYGEIWDWMPESDSTSRQQVREEPTSETVEVLRPDKSESWWERVRRSIGLVLAFAGGVVFGFFGGRILP